MSRVIELDDTFTEKAIDDWKKSIIEAYTDSVTENGNFPHRSGQTHMAHVRMGVHKLCELAKYAVRVKRRHGKIVDRMVAERLVELAEKINRSK